MKASIQQITLKTLVLSLVVGLQACGGGSSDPAPVVATPVPAPTTVAPTTNLSAQSDYVRAVLIPMYQNYYGNMYFSQAVTISGGNISAATAYTWDQIYSIITTGLASANCAGTTTGPNPATANGTMPAWANLNYGCYSNTLNTANYGSLGAVVQFQNQPQIVTTAQQLIQELVMLNYNFYQQYGSWYAQTYYGQGGYQVPYWQGYSNGYLNNGGTYLGGGLNYNNGQWNGAFTGSFHWN